ncbi:hypothetical protein LINGRAHAP2_LOCUS19875 [Linum grandiflorum]
MRFSNSTTKPILILTPTDQTEIQAAEPNISKSESEAVATTTKECLTSAGDRTSSSTSSILTQYKWTCRVKQRGFRRVRSSESSTTRLRRRPPVSRSLQGCARRWESEDIWEAAGLVPWSGSTALRRIMWWMLM